MMTLNRGSWPGRRVFRALAAGLLTAAAVNAAPRPLKVAGNELENDLGGRVMLRGVNCAGMEWSDDSDGHMLKTVEVAVVEWHANLIRLPLAQDRWFGRAPGQEDGGARCRALVQQLVDFCSAHDADLILDLHWSDAGEWGKHIDQHNLPDRNSVVFWKEVAAAFANDPAEIFDLDNEPSHVTWDQWFAGGPIAEVNRKQNATYHYEAVGLPALAAAIQATGARNLIIAGGINWAYEVEGIPGGREITDPGGNGVVYAVHPYPHSYEGLGRETIPQWTARMEKFAAKFPIVVTEFGSIERMWAFPKEWAMNDEKWNRAMLAVLAAHRWSWTAWDFHPSASPCLISDWNYTPTPEFGRWVKQALVESTPPIP